MAGMSTVRLEAVATEAKREIPMQPASLDIWDKKYRLKTKQGVALDADIDGTYQRVAKALADAEPTAELQQYWMERFTWALRRGAIPAGRITSNAGALVNLNGELVGINTASFNPRGSMAGNIGLGFAIPSNLASNIKDQLLVGGVVRRGTLGIDTQDVDARIAAALGLAQPRGAVVTRVYPGSAGAAAGLKPGDVILAANGEPIADAEALRNFQGLQPANARVALDVRRDGQPLQLTTGLREVPKALAGAQLDARLAGASFADLPESLRRQGLAGVLVEQVERDSRAARSGLRKGDVVLAASSGDFTDLGGFRAGFAAPPPQLVLRVLRGRSSGQLQMR